MNEKYVFLDAVDVFTAKNSVCIHNYTDDNYYDFYDSDAKIISMLNGIHTKNMMLNKMNTIEEGLITPARIDEIISFLLENSVIEVLKDE